MVLAACTSSIDNNTVENHESVPLIENGIIQFKNASEFGDTMEKLNRNDENFKNSLHLYLDESRFQSLVKSNSVSYDPIYQALNNHLKKSSDSTDTITEIVEDPNFATILNDKGIVRIDSLYFRVTRDYLFWVPLTQLDLIKDDDYLVALVANESVPKKYISTLNTPTGEIAYEKIDRQDIMLDYVEPDYTVGAPSTFTWHNYVYNDIPESFFEKPSSITRYHNYGSDPKRRMEAKIWNTNYFIYASFGAATHNEKQSVLFGAFFDAECDSIGVKVTAKYKYEIKSPVSGLIIDSGEKIVDEPFRYLINKEQIVRTVDYKIAQLGFALNWHTFTFAMNTQDLKFIADAFKIVEMESNHYLSNIVGQNGYRISSRNKISF